MPLHLAVKKLSSDIIPDRPPISMTDWPHFSPAYTPIPWTSPSPTRCSLPTDLSLLTTDAKIWIWALMFLFLSPVTHSTCCFSPRVFPKPLFRHNRKNLRFCANPRSKPGARRKCPTKNQRRPPRLRQRRAFGRTNVANVPKRSRRLKSETGTWQSVANREPPPQQDGNN